MIKVQCSLWEEESTEGVTTCVGVWCGREYGETHTRRVRHKGLPKPYCSHVDIE